MSAPDFRLDGRSALVTGASSGLGRHFAGLLAAQGASVAVAARRVDQLASLVDEIRTLGGRALAVRLDVTDPASVEAALSAMAEELGVPDVVINNAGLTVTRPLLEQTVADFDSVMDTNLRGCWLVATAAARRMVAAGRAGSIVNIASILGERVAGGVAPYAISKAGVIQATKAMALELARHRIRVNALLPGYVVASLVHLAFNQFTDHPMEVMIVTLILAPVILIGLMRLGEGETHKWLVEESESHRQWLQEWRAGGFPKDVSGQRLAALAARSTPAEAELIRAYCTLKTELVLAAEEELLDRDRQLEAGDEERLRTAFAELDRLKQALGRVGHAAVRRNSPFSANDEWELSELKELIDRD